MGIKPDHKFERDTGILSPEGVLYPCDYFGHDTLAYDMGLTSSWHARKDHGWLHLSEGRWGAQENGDKPPTQAQITAIFDWTQKAPNRYLPVWYKEAVAA